MKNLTKLKLSGVLLAAVYTVGVAPSATAAPQFAGGLSDLEIVNAENVYRSEATCAAAGGCLGPIVGDPAGYLRPDPSIPDNILVGDLFIGVANFRNITNAIVGPTWSTDVIPPIDNFTSYFVQEVKSVALDIAGPGSRDRILLGSATVADPFGILSVGGADASLATEADNEMYRLFVDEGPGATQYLTSGLGLTTLQSVTLATDGLLWAALGVGTTVGTAAAPALDADGYIYSEVQIGGGTASFVGDFFASMNVLTEGPAWNIGADSSSLGMVNDPQEISFGGTLPGDPFTTGLNNLLGVCTPSAAYACNHIAGNGQLSVSPSFLSPWQFASEDPLQLYAIPEPGMLSLLGLGLIGMGIGNRRRKARS